MSESTNDADTSKNLILLVVGLILTTIGVAAIAAMIAY
jgi:hypothetical protein